MINPAISGPADSLHAGASILTRQPARSTLPGMITRDSIDAMIRECSMYEEHLSSRLADAERDAPESVTTLVDLIDRIRRLKAELVAAHPKRLADKVVKDRRGP